MNMKNDQRVVRVTIKVSTRKKVDKNISKAHRNETSQTSVKTRINSIRDEGHTSDDGA